MVSPPDSQSEEVSPEWDRLRSLRLHRGRLVNRSDYQPLNTAQLREDARRKTGIKYGTTQSIRNAPKSFDIGFREILRRNDLDVFFNGALDRDAMHQARTLLSKLCQQLEKVVNPEILGSSLPKQKSSTIHASSYPQLDSLISTLNGSKWNFEVITGTAPKLFRIRLLSEVKKTRDIVDEFTAHFNKLTSPTLEEARPPIDHRLLESARASLAHDHLSTDLRGLTALLRKLKKLPNCGRCHSVMLQLADWHVGTSAGSKPARLVTNFDLFVSLCRVSERLGWQECFFYPRLPLDQSRWAIEGLCEEILDATTGISAVHLAAHGEDVFIVDATGRGNMQPSLQSKSSPTSLRKLFQAHAFMPHTAQLYNFRRFRFSDDDKKLLAIRLVSSLILSLDSGQVLKCWDPEAVYFPSQSNGECQPKLPYAMSVLEEEVRATIYGSGNSGLLDTALEDIVFPRLAKLLFEIKFGLTRDDIQDDDGNERHGSSTLEDAINEAVESDLSSKPFLEAVNICRTFRQRYVEVKRVLRRVDAKNPIPASAVRNLICVEIVQLIEGLAQYQEPEEDRLKVGADVAWAIFPVSSSHGQLGFSGGPPAELPPELPSNDHASTRTKRVKFNESTTRQIEADAVVGSLHDIKGNQGNSEDSRQFFRDMEQFQQECYDYSLSIETRHLSLEQQQSTALPRPKIRIAVLDTGIDMNHWKVSDAFDEGRMSRERCYNWTYDTNGIQDPTDVHDSAGHGTNVAELLMRIAPDAEICIAKVLNLSIIKLKEVKYIAKAIKHAVDRDKWDADIVVMSFGLNANPGDDSEDELSQYRAEIAEQIETRPGKIFIAAAGNEGRNKPRSFPASIMSSNVICIHASHGNGNEGGISPYAKSSDDNFMTLGMDIEFDVVNDATVPNQGEPARAACKSGTSWATPIAAGIAANILHIIDVMDFKQATRTNLRKGSAMKQMFRKMSDGGAKEYRYIAPWAKLWRPGWEKSESMIRDIETHVRAAANPY